MEEDESSTYRHFDAWIRNAPEPSTTAVKTTTAAETYTASEANNPWRIYPDEILRMAEKFFQYMKLI